MNNFVSNGALIKKRLKKRNFLPERNENTYYSRAHGVFSRIGFRLRLKYTLQFIFKDLTTSKIFSENNGIKLNIIRNFGETSNMSLNDMA